MADYEATAEGALLAEEEMVEQAEADRGDAKQGHFHAYLSFYITAISLTVAVAALLTAMAADQSMEETLGGLTDMVRSNGLRVELRCHEIQQELAQISGRTSVAEVAPLLTDASHKLANVENESLVLRREAAHTGKAHYVLAVGITFLQIATGLAATVGITKKRHLLIPSAMFALGGLVCTAAGVVDYLA